MWNRHNNFLTEVVHTKNMNLFEEVDVVFFDIDGTLFDQRLAHELALKEIHHGWDIFRGVTAEQLIKAFKIADEAALKRFHEGVDLEKVRSDRSRKVLELLDIDTGHAEEFNSLFYDTYPKMEAGFKGIHEVIDRVEEDHDIGIISNGSKDVQTTKLEAVDLLNRFRTLVFSEEVGYRKPDERIFLHAANLIGARPNYCLYIGDFYMADIVGAHNAGMYTCWINHHGDRPQGLKPDIELKGIDEILEVM